MEKRPQTVHIQLIPFNLRVISSRLIACTWPRGRVSFGIGFQVWPWCPPGIVCALYGAYGFTPLYKIRARAKKNFRAQARIWVQTRIPKCYSTVRNVFEKYGTCSKYIWDSQNIILILKIYLRFSKYIWDSQNIWVKSQNIFFLKIKYETSKHISNFQNLLRFFIIFKNFQ